MNARKSVLAALPIGVSVALLALARREHQEAQQKLKLAYRANELTSELIRSEEKRHRARRLRYYPPETVNLPNTAGGAPLVCQYPTGPCLTCGHEQCSSCPECSPNRGE